MNIVDEANEVVARREFVLDPKGARCVCLWNCSCVCFESSLTTEVNNLCHAMSPENEIYAGFYDERNFDELMEKEESIDFKTNLLLMSPLIVILVALLLGKSFCLNSLGSDQTNEIENKLPTVELLLLLLLSLESNRKDYKRRMQ